MIKAGSVVIYIGPDTVAFETGNTYKVVGYVNDLDLYRVISELEEAYCLPKEYLMAVQE